jgi:hypothetical protein
MKPDIKDFVSQTRRSKYYRVNKLPGFLDAQNPNLFVMYAKARFQTKFEHSGSRFDLIQLLNFISKTITSPKLLAHYVNYL